MTASTSPISDTNSKHAVLYLRVSTPRQMETAIDIDPDGNSIATQRELTQRRALSVNAVVDKEFIEPGNSAQTIEKRPIFRQMLRYLAEHPEIDYVIIYMRSRAFRNSADAAITKRQLEKFGIRMLSAKEDFGEGYIADAMEGIIDIFNELEVRRNGEDIRVKLQHKAKSGGTISRARIGYLNTRVPVEGRLVNSIGVDLERADFVRQAFELYATGDYAIATLVDIMTTRGLTTRPSPKRPAKPLGVETMRKMLRDPYYTGVMVYKGEIVPEGRHPALISKALFERVQQVLDVRSRRGQRDRVLAHYLKGLLFCDRCHQRNGIENRLIYTEAKGRNGQLYGYFFCLGRQDGVCNLPHLPSWQVEAAVARHYEQLRLDEAFTSEIDQQLTETMIDQEQLTRELHQTLKKQLGALENREDRLLDLAADGVLSKDKIQERVNTIRMERLQIEEGLTNTTAELEIGAEKLRRGMELARRPAEMYEEASDRSRRQLNQAFYERLYIDELPEVSITRDVLHPPFGELRDASWVYAQQKALSFERNTVKMSKSPNRTVRALTFDLSRAVALADIFPVGVSSKTVLVGADGFEPPTARV